jgi:hypothetical protein
MLFARVRGRNAETLSPLRVGPENRGVRKPRTRAGNDQGAAARDARARAPRQFALLVGNYAAGGAHDADLQFHGESVGM